MSPPLWHTFDMRINHFYQSFDVERRDQSASLPLDDYRTPFQQDRDRIIHTAAFRRLQNKTQVFFSGEYDFYRTRLTHSIEVAQIGRGICQRLQVVSDFLGEDYYIDSDLVEACCLAHDLGHPPFGHTGERVLHRLMKPWGGFEGNAQTLRLLGETAFGMTRGINPARGTVDGVLKYKSLYSERPDPLNHFIYDDQAAWLRFAHGIDETFPDSEPPGSSRNKHRSIECQIMDWADDTAYSLNDIADGIYAGFLTIEKIENWAEEQELSDHEAKLVEGLLEIIRRKRIESTIGYKIGQFIRHTNLEEREHFLAGFSNRYMYQIVVPSEIVEECELYKRIAFQIVFRSQKMRQLDRKADLILEKLFNELKGQYIDAGTVSGSEHYQLLSDDEESLILAEEVSEADRARFVCDALARMTDGEVRRTYQRLFEVDYGSIGDLT